MYNAIPNYFYVSKTSHPLLQNIGVQNYENFQSAVKKYNKIQKIYNRKGNSKVLSFCARLCIPIEIRATHCELF